MLAFRNKGRAETKFQKEQKQLSQGTSGASKQRLESKSASSSLLLPTCWLPYRSTQDGVEGNASLLLASNNELSVFSFQVETYFDFLDVK